MISNQKMRLIYIIGILESIILVIVVYIIFVIIFYKSEIDIERNRRYECGFEPKSYTRLTFSYRFFLISILFIIFDVEISLILPVPFLMDRYIRIWIFNLFLFILLIGLIYEYVCGSLDWIEVHN